MAILSVTVALAYAQHYCAAIISLPPILPPPSVVSCTGGLQAANGTAVTFTLNNLAAGQSLVLFHKGVTGNPGESDSVNSTWSEAAGADTNSQHCVQASYTITPNCSSFPCTDTITANSLGAATNDFGVLCSVNNLNTVDLAGGAPFTAQSTTPFNAQTGSATPFSSSDLALGLYYIEAASPGFAGPSSNVSGTGGTNSPTDLVLGGTFANSTQLIGAVTEPDTKGTAANLQRQFTVTGNYCGGIIELSSVAIPVSSLSVSCSPSLINTGSTTQCAATATLTNGNQQAVTPTWNSSAPATASINNSGLVTGNNLGSTTITGTYQGVSGQTTVTVATNTVNDEFVGPFASWLNVATANSGGSTCAAAVSGTDSTTAIQCYLTYLQSHSAVLYFPAGTYIISSTLTFNNTGASARIVGADPATTILKWTGGASPFLSLPFALDFSEIDRLTLDGSGVATNGILMTTNGGHDGRYTDIVFKNFTTAGVFLPSGGTNSDTQVWWRDQFINDATGISDNSFNGFNWSCWYCTFVNNGTGVLSNNGTVAVLYSAFTGSTVADIRGITYVPTIIRGNVSSGSNAFYSQGSLGIFTNPIVFQQNRILNTTAAAAITDGFGGGKTYLDNQIVSKAGNTTAPIVQNAGNDGSGNSTNAAFAVGNQFTVNAPYITQTGSNPRMIETGDSTVSATSVSAACPDPAGASTNTHLQTCFPAPPFVSRQCYFGGGSHAACGTAGSDETSAANIQADINAACPSGYTGGNRPVIHLPVGNYSISSTLTFPGNNCDIQFLGDTEQGGNGGGTVLTWTGGAGGQMIQLHSPSKVSISEMSFQGQSNANILLINSEDVAGSRINVAGMSASFSGAVGNWATMDDTGGGGHVALNIYDPNLNPWNATNYQFNSFGNGSSTGTERIGVWNGTLMGGLPGVPVHALWNVSNQGNLLIEGSYGEDRSNVQEQAFNLTSANSGTLALGGTAYAWTEPSNVAFLTVNGFNGTVTLASGLNSDFASGNPQIGFASVSGLPVGTNVLIEGGNFYNPNFATDGGAAWGTNADFASNFYYNNAAGQAVVVANQGSMSLAQMATNMAFLRNNSPSQDTALPSGVSDVQISRIEVDNTPKAINVVPGP